MHGLLSWAEIVRKALWNSSTFCVNIHFFRGRVFISLNVAVFLAGGAAVVVAQVLSAGADVTDDLGKLVSAVSIT